MDLREFLNAANAVVKSARKSPNNVGPGLIQWPMEVDAQKLTNLTNLLPDFQMFVENWEKHTVSYQTCHSCGCDLNTDNRSCDEGLCKTCHSWASSKLSDWPPSFAK